MLFVKCECLMDRALFNDDEELKPSLSGRTARIEKVKIIAKRAMKSCGKCGSFFFVSDIFGTKITLGAILVKPSDVENFKKFAKSFSAADNIDAYPEEITYNSLVTLLNKADNVFISDSYEILNSYDIQVTHYMTCFSEKIAEAESRKKLYIEAEETSVSETLKKELDRIFCDDNARQYYGNPVHYLLNTDGTDETKKVSTVLLNALYAGKRVINKRYCYIDIASSGIYRIKDLKQIYSINVGGTVILDLTDAEDINETAETICDTINKYRNSVLTVLVFPKSQTREKEDLLSYLSDLPIVEFAPIIKKGKEAKAYLRKRAKKDGVTYDGKLLSEIKPDAVYDVEKLNAIYQSWFDNKLKKSIYPSYRDIKCTRKENKTEECLFTEKIESSDNDSVMNDILSESFTEQNSAYNELTEMIGLDEAKKTIKLIIDFVNAQKIYSDNGISLSRPSLHCIFTGNPGTAKTTVARLFSDILKEIGYLKKGHIVECGRADLVDRYVGGTAPKVKRKFEEAKGGCLFIDEVYSLVDDRSGSFGDEAINTIVQEMENNREDVVVIFAGYPDKMKTFLDKNPGLRSRIPFTIRFEDYTAAELTEIAKLIAKKKGFVLTDDACEKMTSHFESARRGEDFGNGRYARNIIEQAQMIHVSKFVNTDKSSVTETALKTISADDICFSDSIIKETFITDSPTVRTIGFCA